MPSQPDLVSRYSGFRPEVQGLRAVAVMMVVVYHVFVGRVSGGVDIFLFISAFFMTLSFVRKIADERPIAIGRYWLHTFKRLLPMAVLTILATAALLWCCYPRRALWDFRPQALWSAFYLQNWYLATTNVDYYAYQSELASPFQHFWSLSIQGQVFLIWPMVFALAWWLSRRYRVSCVPVLAVGFGAIFAASLTYSIVSTATRQQFAYFDTGARLWEFALGSLVALAIPYLRPARAGRVLLGWTGLVGMISCGIVIDVATAFPGWIALWPLASAAAIMVAGQSGSPLGVDRFLAWRPIVKLGDAAYSLYLVHWPLLITYLVVSDRQVAEPWAGAALIVASVVLAVVLNRLIDEPLRRWAWPEVSKTRMGAVVATCLLVVALPIGSWLRFDQQRVDQLEAQAKAEAHRNNPGALALLPGFEYAGDPDAQVLPLIETLDNQWVQLRRRCSGRLTPTDKRLADLCRQADRVRNPVKTVVVVGNSHAEQLVGAIVPVAAEQGWQLVSLIQSGCSFGLTGQPDECFAINEAFVEYLEQLQPDVVITISTWGAPVDDQPERVVRGHSEAIDRLVSAGISVVGVRDNPRWIHDPVACLESTDWDVDACTPSVDDLLAETNPAEQWQDRDGYTILDFTDLICPDGWCEPVIGNVLVWLDNNHLTADYVETMGLAGRERILAAVGQ